METTLQSGAAICVGIAVLIHAMNYVYGAIIKRLSGEVGELKSELVGVKGEHEKCEREHKVSKDRIAALEKMFPPLQAKVEVLETTPKGQ